jgi:putative salt-induced outer membrane protein
MKDVTRPATILAIALAGFAPALAEEEPERSWSNTAEFSLVNTTGNSETTNLAGSNKFVYTWSNADFTLDAAFLRTEATTRALSNPDGTVVVDETTSKTAESYALGAKYRKNLSERILWYTAAGWMRNEFAGIEDRYNAGAGFGYRFFTTEVHSLTGEVGVDYTDESFVGGTSASYAGARGFLGYERTLSPSSKLNAELEIHENLDDTDDLRAKGVVSVSASLTQKLALKAGYTVLYDRRPVEVIVPGAAPGVPDAAFVFDKTDTIFQASLVVNF